MSNSVENASPAPIDAPASADDLNLNNSAPAGQGANMDLLSHLADTHAAGYEGFDPSIHAKNDDGTPKLTKGGEYAKKRGRKAGQSLPSTEGVSTDRPIIKSPSEVAEATAKVAANTLFNVSVMVFGEEWKPEKEEAIGIKDAFKDYFEASGIVEIPPSWGLIFALGAYAMPRLTMPQTKSKLAVIKDKIVSSFGFFGKIKAKIAGF